MCDINRKTKYRTIKGYKILAKKNGKYYSSFTGQEIKVGKVPLPPERCIRLSSYWSFNLDERLLTDCMFYNSEFAGKTAIYFNKNSVLNLYNRFNNWDKLKADYKFIIVKITLGKGEKGIWEGEYDEAPIYASDTILKIEEVPI